MSKKSDLREVFLLIRELNNSLLELRLKRLPQPFFLMLQERIVELREAIRRSAHRVFRRKTQSNVKYGEQFKEMEQTLAAVHRIFRQLNTILREIDADLATAEMIITHKSFIKKIDFLTQRVREVGADTEKQIEVFSPAQVFKCKTDDIKEITRSIGHLTKSVANLNQWANNRIADYCKELDNIFKKLERTPSLAKVNKDVVIELRGIAYKSIAASGLFEKSFYLSQLPDNGKGVRDALKHYLVQTHNISPCPFFNGQFYTKEYEFVTDLRYNPLEHFVRYGESMRLNPDPEIDILFYLKNNEDVLKAGVSPYRHFVRHGMGEDRPPSSRAGRFFSRMYINNRGGRLAFLDSPKKEERMAWKVFQACCSEKESGSIINLSVDELSRQIIDYDGIVVGEAALARLDDKLFSVLASSEAPLVYIGCNPHKDLQGLIAQKRFLLTKVCAITNNYEQFLRWQESCAPIRLLYYPFKNAEESMPLVQALLSKLTRNEEFNLRRFVQPYQNDAALKPAISVVSIIYKKPDEMLAFLESLNTQDIACPYEVILVDDASPDDTVDQVKAWLERKLENGLINRHMTVRILQNATNSGNCLSRNKGIEAAKSDIVLVADGDMVFGTSNLSEHVWAYRFGDCDAAIGFSRFDLNKEFVVDWLAACEVDNGIIQKKLSRINDLLTAYGVQQFNRNGIFNFITRNVSFKKKSIKGEFFDLDFSYSTKPDSGYGVEDQEFGARLYFAGAKIRSVDRAIAIHTRHATNSYNENKMLAMLRNWEKLLAKHPDLALVERQYYQEKTMMLLDRTASRREAPEYIAAKKRFAAPERTKLFFKVPRPLRVLTYMWHAPHQYEFFKRGQCEVVLATNIGSARCNQWDFGQRPMPQNIYFRPLEAIDPNEYDLAVLPFDEQILHAEHSMLPQEWGNAFFTMLEATKDIPRLALCHGTPKLLYTGESVESRYAQEEMISGSRKALRDLLGDTHVVCCSHQAQREWNFAKSSVIWPGFSPVEFPPGKHRQECLTLSHDDFDINPIRNGEGIRQRVADLLGEKWAMEYSDPPAPHPGYVAGSQEWALVKFQNYVEYIGDFSIFFNPTIFSPMPSSRGEAMMTGTIPVSLRNHDVDMFIQNGRNGFYGDSAEELAEQISWLLKHEKERRKISQNARLTGMDIFNIDRHLSAWNELISQIV